MNGNMICPICGGRWLLRCPGELPGECPWCEIRRLKAEVERLRHSEAALEAELMTLRGMIPLRFRVGTPEENLMALIQAAEPEKGEDSDSVE